MSVNSTVVSAVIKYPILSAGVVDESLSPSVPQSLVPQSHSP